MLSAMFRHGGMTRALVVLGVLIALAVAACGGGSSTSSDSKSAAPAGGAEGEQAAPAVPDGPAGASGVLESDPVAPGAERLIYKYGPIKIEPGQNNIDFTEQIDMPEEDGWIVRTAVDVMREDGSIPAVDVIHLHHGVWLNTSRADPTSAGLPERYFAAGEEKTIMTAPEGFGYDYKAGENWIINYMIHNQVPATDEVYLAWSLDFIPMDAPEAADIKTARPVWMDVQNGSAYPVFDVLPNESGEFTYPDDATDPYAGEPAPLNEWVVDRDGVLIGTGGHLHPGGQHADLSVLRGDQTALIYRSDAEYFNDERPISWDLSMTATPLDWRVAVKAGDVMSMNVTYETDNLATYEAMGIMVVWMADGVEGPDPFSEDVLVDGEITHGHLAENDNAGGSPAIFDEDPADLPSGPEVQTIKIEDFVYEYGDLSEETTDIPTVRQGSSIVFDNGPDAPKANGIWHTITSCKSPCNGATGIAFPLADGEAVLDSGELGDARGINALPTAGRVTWETPADLAPGTYTYFCRIHPFMRGAFRVTPNS
jgi:hypothetical protein